MYTTNFQCKPLVHTYMEVTHRVNKIIKLKPYNCVHLDCFSKHLKSRTLQSYIFSNIFTVEPVYRIARWNQAK